jgi:hypothetical protein
MHGAADEQNGDKAGKSRGVSGFLLIPRLLAVV